MSVESSAAKQPSEQKGYWNFFPIPRSTIDAEFYKPQSETVIDIFAQNALDSLYKKDPHLFGLTHVLLQKTGIESKFAYLEGAMKVYTVMETHAKQISLRLPQTPLYVRELYEQNFHTSLPASEAPPVFQERVIKPKVSELPEGEKLFLDHLSPVERPNIETSVTKRSFTRGVHDIYFTVRSAIHGKVFDSAYPELHTRG